MQESTLKVQIGKHFFSGGAKQHLFMISEKLIEKPPAVVENHQMCQSVTNVTV